MDKCFVAYDSLTNRHSCVFNANHIFQTKLRKFTELFKAISVAITKKTARHDNIDINVNNKQCIEL